MASRCFCVCESMIAKISMVCRPLRLSTWALVAALASSMAGADEGAVSASTPVSVPGFGVIIPAEDDLRRDIDRARALAVEGQTTEALDVLEEVLGVMGARPGWAALRSEVVAAHTEIALTAAELQARRGDFEQARVFVGRVLAPNVNPESRAAARLLAALDDPDRTPPAMSPRLVEDRERVIENLRMGESHLLLGNPDDAENSFYEVLHVDRYNTAARRGLERVERVRQDAAASARSHTRARMLRQVGEAWEGANPEQSAIVAGIVEAADLTTSEIEARNLATALRRKADRLILDRVDIDGASFRDAVAFLSTRSRAADTEEPDPASRGIDIVVRAATVHGEFERALADREISMSLSNVPFSAALQYLAEEVGMVVRYESFAAVLLPPGSVDGSLFTRTYRVPPDFIASVPSNGGAADDPFARADAGPALTVRRMNAQEFLAAAGIDFPEGAFARFNRASSTVTMRNTSEAHVALEDLIEAAGADSIPQVAISVRMLEVEQTTLNELGFDWLMGAFRATGDTIITGGTGDAIQSGGGVPLNNVITGEPIGSFPITGGNRSGQGAITGRGLDNLLGAGSAASLGRTGATRAPAPLAMAGVLTQPDFQVVMRALAQKTGRDFMNSPTVITRSGQLARVEMVREFIHPTEYDPPELPNTVGSSALGGGGFPVTPANPTAFDTTPVGTVLEVEPVVSSDGSVLQISVQAVHREFIGFINYGTPIFTTPDVDQDPVLVTENRILMPLFETRRVQTNNSIYDGQSMVIGGLLSHSNEVVEDRTPLFSSIPVVGRMFKSKANRETRRVLLIFLQADVLDPSGQPRRDRLVSEPGL